MKERKSKLRHYPAAHLRRGEPNQQLNTDLSLLGERDDMSEVKTGYMADLDAWTNKAIIEPLSDAYLRGPEEVIANAEEYARKMIRDKVLESYRNGQNAGPRKVFKRR